MSGNSVIIPAVARALRAGAYFLFDGGSPRAAALFRILFGLSLLMLRLSLLPDLTFFYSSEGLLPNEQLSAHQNDRFWSLLHFVDSPAAVQAVNAIYLVVLVSVVAGFYTRPMTVLLFLMTVSFKWRNPLIINMGDEAASVVSFWLMFANSGYCWSVDAWRRQRARRPLTRWQGTWALRCMQFQLCFIYFCTAMQKLTDPDWLLGNAMFYVAALVYDWVRPMTAMMDYPLVYKSLTYVTFGFEIAFPCLVWFRRLRLPMVAMGIVFHLGIAILLGLHFICWIMIAMLMLFAFPSITPPWAEGESGGLADDDGSAFSGQEAKTVA
jgi:hypothetical protein